MIHQLLVVPAVGGLVEHSRSQVGRAVGQPLAALTTIFLGQAAARCPHATIFLGLGIAVQENHGLRAGWAEKSMSQPLAVVFLPAVGGFLPWRGQLWRRTPTLVGHSQ